MFRNRTSSQKPGDAFIANFRQSFPEVSVATSIPGSGSGSNSHGEATAGPDDTQHLSLGHEDLKDLDPTPRAQHEPWRFTPSLLDPNSFAFSAFANQPPGYYTPTPGGNNTFYHNQAGDLHTPGMGMGMGPGTPLSLPTSADGMHASTMMDMSAFSHQMPPQFHTYNPFGAPQQQHHQQHQHNHEQHHQTSYAPSSFVHQDTGYETMEHDGSPLDDDEGRMGSIEANFHHRSPMMSFQPAHYNVPAVMPASAENFRFHVTLNAPTAMIKSSDEIPITYLNKGQAYSISIVDSAPHLPLPQGAKYRTFVRISFEDEQQRQRPGTCWQLWKEGRGTNEAHQRGGKLQAVEYVEANQPAENDDKRTRVEIDTASFDGFSVIWTPGANGTTECNIAVRFNFLSTDFSHSKGVKGIPVRLCAKTETISTGSPGSGSEYSEVAFCKVKLFRDHGAERKLSNDVAHVKKTIDKLKQQISQAETGMKDFGKRKRTGPSNIKSQQPSQRPGKVQKHKRTWSMSSTSSAGGRMPVEEDLHYKLQIMQDMFTSTRPVSILYLRGAEQDDPDLHPVALAGEPLDLTKVDSRSSAVWQQRRSDRSSTTGTSSLVSPSPSSLSLQSQAITATTAPAAPGLWSDFNSLAPTEVKASKAQLANATDELTKVARTDAAGNHSGWVETMGVDAGYQPPVGRPIKPVACFYALLRDPLQPEKPEHYRAIYLMQRTLKDFTNMIATKWNVEATKIVRTLHILDRGLEVEVDDDVIREMAEGQVLTMEIAEVPIAASVKREWEITDVTADSDNTSGTQHVTHTEGYELRLMF
ncbi:related to transcription factor BOM [Rhynchosporium secalis]|uniref:Related to transcription factor BOM n=1 Tax=Rhynchosporium secalis TaxID=38038 RepID=A0A1E1M0G8_RHYSE|nr:related to transcription factor BOM [Rhynchosporium secalis]